MRILLTANASYVPPRGGATRSNLLWLEHLAGQGHECRVVCAALAGTSDREKQLRDEQLHRQWQLLPSTGETEALRSGNITVYAVVDPTRMTAVLRTQIREFQPDWVLVSSEDLGHTLLREALQSARGRVVYLAHTPQFFPFGPESWNAESDGAAWIRQCAAVVVIGRHMADYVERHTGRQPVVIHPPMYGPGPWDVLADPDAEFVTMINPCTVKGIGLFLQVADGMPEVQFAAVPGWGTTSADRAELARRPNVTTLPNTREIDEILRRTRVLLMPSLWYEGFGLIVMEAMLRGIPVIASDSGGLQEAKEGTGFVIPVEPIRRYERVFDERAMPRPVLPPLDAAPWIEALRALLTDRELYRSESDASRQAALQFVSNLQIGQMEEMLLGLAEKKTLRILLAQNSLYYPAHGGGDKSNRLLIEALAARGHECRVVARIANFGPQHHDEYLRTLADRGVTVLAAEAGVVTFRQRGVEVHVVTAHPNLRAYFASQVQDFRPDIIITSTDDPAQLLLELALKEPVARVVYLARATLALPFGPDCAFPSAAKTDTLRRVDGLVGVSEYVARYVREHSGIPAIHVPISLMDHSSAPDLGHPGNEFVVLVNPCAVKGISIFLGLAERLPHLQFAAVPTWGTNAEDRAAMERLPNVHVLDPVDNIDDLLARTSVLLVPSLWAEARSRIVVEAMQRGIPVIASDVGGIPEAKMGVPYLLPVNPIRKYQHTLDEQMVPVAEVPPQDLNAWEAALRRLLEDPAHYHEISRASRLAATHYIDNLNAFPFERLLRGLNKQPLAAATVKTPSLAQLSPEKRRLLALRLEKSKRLEDAWFPNARQTTGQFRLFCFPHAGGGAAAFQGWQDRLYAAVCPVRLPGREKRASEKPLQFMDELVEAVGNAILPYLDKPFAFFGHSMGAIVGFELARWLRARQKPAPLALLASGARAPQFRRGHLPPPDPDEATFLAELRRLEGVPAAVLDHPELLRVLLPALRGDTSLYRNYVYREQAPLSCAIRAYGGDSDPNVTLDHLRAWKEQTTASFGVRQFPGGHFFLQSMLPQFLDALRADLQELA